MSNGKQNPFCIFKLGSVAKKTKTDQNGGQSPIWDDQINLPVPPGATRLFVQIFSGQASKENLISEGHVDLNEVLRKGEHDGFFPLVLNGKKAGQIYLELTYYAGQVHTKHQQQQQQHQYPVPHIRQYTNQPPPLMNRSSQPRPYPTPHLQPNSHPAAIPMPPPQNQAVRYSSTLTNQSPVISSPYQQPPNRANVIPSSYQCPRPHANDYFPRPIYPQPRPQFQPQHHSAYATPQRLQHHHSFNGAPSQQLRPYSSRPPPFQQQQSFPPHPLPPQQPYPNRPYSRQQQHPSHPSGYPPY
ncbi:unnamed protein product [Absidia cylindrospora]